MSDKLFFIETSVKYNFAILHEYIDKISDNNKIVPIPTIISQFIIGLLHDSGKLYTVINPFYKITSDINMNINKNLFVLTKNNIGLAGIGLNGEENFNINKCFPLTEALEETGFFDYFYVYKDKKYAIINVEKLKETLTNDLKAR